MGFKILDKLQKQQAGEPSKNKLRILAINFRLTDTPDLTFFNQSKYYSRFIENMKFLARDIKPFPPYDIVLACDLGFNCGFSIPVNLSNHDDKFISRYLSKINLDTSIKEIPVASKNEVEKLLDSLKQYSKGNIH